jgi:hypothetical protein
MFMMRVSARRQLVAWALLVAAAASDGLGTVASASQALAPVARSAVVVTQEGVAKTGVLPATDPESDPLTFSVVTPPTKGTLTITNAAAGAFTFTPNAGAVGYDTFVYRAADATGGSNAMGFVFIVTATPTWPGSTARASVANDGSQLTTPSNMGAWPNADGRFIVFTSGVLDESTLTVPSVFVRDRQTGQTTLVSKATGSDVSIGGIFPAISADGRFIAFTSLASALPGGHPSALSDLYLHDRMTGQTERVSVSSSGIAGNAESVFGGISADGRYVAFSSTATNLAPGDTDDDNDVYVRDRQLGITTLVSVSSAGVKGDSGGWLPVFSADGRFVSFNSESTNLVPDDTNGRIDLFVRDLHSNQTTRVSVGTGGTQANSDSLGRLSADGRFAVVESDASNLVAGDTNGLRDIFVHDRQTGQTTRVSVSTTGVEANGESSFPTLSADGRYVLFGSSSTNLVSGDTNGLTDVFAHDRQTGQTVRVNVASDGTQANAASVGDDNGCCAFPSISDDGRSAVVVTLASNLVPGDTNGLDDVFVVGPVSVGPTAIDVPGTGGNGTANVAFAYAGTPWTATTATPWITINAPAGGSTSGIVTFTAAPNAGAARTGTLTVALKTITVTQPGVTTPQPPTGLFASSIVGNTLTLRFTPPEVGPAATGFLLEGGVSSGETLASIPTGSTAPIFTIEAPDGAFYVRMRTLTAAGTSGPSNEIRVFIDVPQAPSAPTNLLATVSGSNLTLAWRNTNGGGVPTSMALDVTGSFVGSLSIPLGDGASFDGVPAGTYTLALRAANSTGSSPASNSVTISFPSTCSGAPLPPANFVVVKTGTNLRLFWDPADSGPAPTDFVLTVTGAFNGSVLLAARTISASVAPGSYNLSIQARNACGTSAATAVQTVVVP